MSDSVGEEKGVISLFCGLELHLNVITQCFFLSSPCLNGKWLESYYLFATNFKPQAQSHNRAQNSSASHMSKICELQLADLPLQPSGSLQKELFLERKWSSHQKLTAILGQ